MISIFFRPDITQVVKAKLTGDRKLSVKKSFQIKSAWKYLKEDSNIETERVLTNEERIFRLSEIFDEINHKVSMRYDDVYVVLPDILFSVSDTIRYVNNQQMQEDIERAAMTSADHLYVAEAFTSSPGVENKRCVYAIKKSVVNLVVKGAEQAGINLSSIEASSVCAIRMFSDWRHEHIILEIFPDNVTFYVYSPLGGIFRLEVDNLTGREINNSPNTAEAILKEKISMLDMVAERTFVSYNVDVPITTLYGKGKIEVNNILSNRSGPRVGFPEFIKAPDDTNNTGWFACLGTLLQVYTEKDVLYENRPDFLKVSSGNVLPEDLQLNTRLLQWRQLTKSILTKLCFIFGFIFLVECGTILYFGSVKISPGLQADYDKAKQNESMINNELNAIELAKVENEYPVLAYTSLIKHKPEKMRLLQFNVGNSSGKGNNSGSWVKFTAVAPDPILFQELMMKLRDDPVFTNCSVADITTDGSGLKKAEFILGKGQGN